MVGGGLGGRHRRPDDVAVAPRADHPVDDRRDSRPLGGERGHELDGPVVDGGQTDGVVAEAGSPVEVGPPCRRVQHEPGAEALGEVQVRRVVGDQAGPPFVGVEQGEGGEVGQVETLVEHEGGLEAAVREEQTAGGELGQGHGMSSSLGVRSQRREVPPHTVRSVVTPVRLRRQPAAPPNPQGERHASLPHPRRRRCRRRRLQRRPRRQPRSAPPVPPVRPATPPSARRCSTCSARRRPARPSSPR